MRGFLLGLSSALVFGTLCAEQAVAEVKSGLQVGEITSAFNVLDITGPNADESLCYR